MLNKLIKEYEERLEKLGKEYNKSFGSLTENVMGALYSKQIKKVQLFKQLKKDMSGWIEENKFPFSTCGAVRVDNLLEAFGLNDE